MTDQRPCGECDGCRWGGRCVRFAVHQDALTGDGATWMRTADGWERVDTAPPALERPTTPATASERHPDAAETAQAAVDATETPIDDVTAMKLLVGWLKRLASTPREKT